MESISTTHPLQLLRELEQSCKKQIPAAPGPQPVWSGLGFRISTYHLCLNSRYIDEVLDSNFQQNLSRVPGAKKWLCGLISLRGQALPVIDFNQYLFDKPSIHSKKSRLLVVKLSKMKTGLIIDEAYGLKRFNKSDAHKTHESESIPDALLNFSEQMFQSDKQSWIEFSIQKLESDSNFLSAARF